MTLNADTYGSSMLAWLGVDNVFSAEAERYQTTTLEEAASRQPDLVLAPSEPYPFRDVHSHVRRVHDAFGPRRMFWGTDWTRLPCPWRQAVTLFTEELPWLPAADLTWVMGRGVCEWLGWPFPAAT